MLTISLEFHKQNNICPFRNNSASVERETHPRIFQLWLKKRFHSGEETFDDTIDDKEHTKHFVQNQIFDVEKVSSDSGEMGE